METVKEMVIDYLKQYHFDGLWNQDGECVCIISDLSPANCMTDECMAGYINVCDCGDHDYHIGAHIQTDLKGNRLTIENAIELCPEDIKEAL